MGWFDSIVVSPLTASGDWLDRLGETMFGIRRAGRTDEEYRKACLEMFSKPPALVRLNEIKAPKKYTGECPCGIAAADCEYHR